VLHGGMIGATDKHFVQLCLHSALHSVMLDANPPEGKEVP
jgi:hypothetical protein